MKNLILYSVLTFFSIYGFFAFIFFIIDFIFEIRFLRNKRFYILMTAKNEVCKIENIVQSLLFKMFRNDIGVADQKVIVIDTGSTDGTFNLLKKIEGNENSVIVLKKEEIVNNVDFF